MPYVEEQDDNQNNGQSNQQVAGGGNTTVPPTLGSSSGTGNAGPSSAPGGGSPKGTSSGQFTNLQSYLDANADQGFGGKVAGNIQSEVDQANKAQQGAGTQFQQQVDQNTIKYDPNLVNQAATDSTNFVQDPNNVAQFAKQRDATYQGPKSLSDDSSVYNNTNQAVQQAYNDANLYNTAGGQHALLTQKYGAPGYSQGQQGLDSLLISNDPNSQKALQGVQQNANQSQNGFQNLQNQLSNYAQQGAATTANTSNQAKGTINGAANTLQNTLNQAVLSGQQFVNNYNPQVQSALKSGDFTQLQGAMPNGLQQGQKVSDWGLNLGNYYTPSEASTNPQSINANTVANSQQVAQMNALNLLANNGATALDPSVAGKYSDPNSLAGTFNMNQFSNDANARSTQFQQLLNDPNFFQGQGVNAAGVKNPFSTGSIMDEMKIDAPAQGANATYVNALPGSDTRAANYAQLTNYLNQLESQYGANSYLNTGGTLGPGPLSNLPGMTSGNSQIGSAIPGNPLNNLPTDGTKRVPQ